MHNPKENFETTIPKKMKKNLKNLNASTLFTIAMMAIFTICSFNSVQGQVTQVGTSQTVYSTSNSLTINKPAGVAVGDLMIINVIKYANGNTAGNAMSGWTKIESALGGSSDKIGILLYRVVDGTEGSSFTYSLGGSNYAQATIIAYTNVDPTSPFDVTPTSITTPSSVATTVNPASVTTVTPRAFILMLGMSFSNATTSRTFSTWSATSTSTLTEVYDNAGTNYVSVGAATGLKSVAGATGNGTITVSGNAYLGGIILAIRPKIRKQFRSITSGNWNATSIWEQSMDRGVTWTAATTTPIYKDEIVTISTGTTVTLTANSTASSVAINGTLNLATYSLTGTEDFIAENSGTLSIGGNSNFPTGFLTKTLNAGFTIDFSGTIDQTINGTFVNNTFSNLKLSGSGKKSLNSNISVSRNWVRTGTATFEPNTYKVIFIGDNSDNQNAVISAPKSSTRNQYGAFGGEIFYDLEINKHNTSTTVGNGTGVNIAVLHGLTITKGTLNIGDSNIVLVSNKNNTASLNQFNSTNASIIYSSTGRFIVQRFIDNSSSTVRTWRMLTAPLQSTESISISEAWQENTESNNYTTPETFNPWPGFGTQITGPKGYTAGNGFDQGSGSSSYSIKYFNAATSSWGYPSTTNKTALMSQSGWAIFIRGDRSFGIANQYTAPTSTVLEPKGKINTGDITVDVVKGKFNLIGNPYPAQINMSNVSIGGKRNGWYELWDPKAFSNYSKTGKYIPFVWDDVAGTYVQANSPVTKWTAGTVESGVAFLINPSGSQMIFHESDKVNNSNSLNGIQNRPSGLTSSSFRCDLAFYDTTASSNYSYIDGTLNLYNSTYSSSVDQFEDVLSAIGGTTTGAIRIAKNGSQLSISKEQPLTENDTIYLNISKLSQMRHRLAFSSKNISMNNTQAYAIDNYLGTSTPITLNNNDSTFLDFEITADPQSNSMNRFMVVFKTSINAPLPVSFTSINAVQQQNKIAVKWEVATETNVNQYEVERSADGINFTTVGTTNVNTHSWIDAMPLQGNNYYRVKCTFFSEQAKYSTIVKVTSDKATSSIELLNNPVLNSLISLQFNNQSKGVYNVNLYNEMGQQVQTAKLSYEGGNGGQSVSVPTSLPKGIYQMELITPANERITKKIMVN
ncbi:T9SS type A sorting domain-containing protein [Ferruginibacter lapsinanis]|uniref:T9SS type A sorting domain-containing protein n=1 Tax=Ferruginibacter lapsinanis TaxID=563172 RepID=UPI001E3286A9|nr:T9SS type A sorting domain-containing protein [Ferruginibacter lapsinanis]UEG48665.1 T9SS type A sorting domain-containing protein [Ferruginibacter lapsinanis]